MSNRDVKSKRKHNPRTPTESSKLVKQKRKKKIIIFDIINVTVLLSEFSKSALASSHRTVKISIGYRYLIVGSCSNIDVMNFGLFSIFFTVAALKMNTGIKELYLADNGFEQEDAIQLGALLRVNNHLQLLDIRCVRLANNSN